MQGYFKQADVGGDEYWYDDDDDLGCGACAANIHGLPEPHDGGWRCLCCGAALTVIVTDAPQYLDGIVGYTVYIADSEVDRVPRSWFNGNVRYVAVPTGTDARALFNKFISNGHCAVSVWPKSK